MSAPGIAKRINRRQLVIAGAALGAASLAATDLAFAGSYGSGDLGPWEGLSRAISTEDQIERVVATNGVYMFGDSISVQDGKALALRLLSRTGAQLAVNNWSGRPTEPAVDVLEHWASVYGLPRRILMATGSNDVFDPPRFATQVGRTMQLAGPERMVCWVNVQVCRRKQTMAVQLADQRNSAWINLQLSDAQKQHPNLRIIHWAEFLAVKPARLAMYLVDGVHTSVPAGQDTRNELIVQALAGSAVPAK
ncbi:hypothetical protein [Kribbella sp. NPDC004536]|uniref:hypothetical protein n=1 Tax=Kribbella sp. NPDC004536 TaxID=3364106 RepID=UPI003674FF25